MNKKILIISNNVISTKNNNGKTIFSFFEDKQKNDIFQLYFSAEKIEIENVEYFQLSDKTILKNFFKKPKVSFNKTNQKKDVKNFENEDNDIYDVIKANIINSNVARIIREFIWKKSTWYEDELFAWIEINNPKTIFFCAGDSGFAYDLVTKIKEKFNMKLVTFVTDDYVLPRKTYNPFFHLRRKYIEIKFKKNIEITDQFFTISPKMKKTYRKSFGIKSEVLANISAESSDVVYNSSLPSKLLYAGGLHYGRDKILIELSNSIERFNRANDSDIKLTLDIYSHQKISESFLKKLQKNNSTSFLGSIEKYELAEKLKENIIPVHVESFKRKYIDATRLSLSTKIPEYLSLGKPILAIGPSSISSMEYLNSVAYCINNDQDIELELEKIFINNKDYNKKIKLSKDLYEKNHNRIKVLKKFNDLIFK